MITPPGEVPAISGYKVIAPIGDGGMGKVYRAISLETGLAVAIKQINGAANLKGELERRLYRELSICSKFRHPSLITVLDAAKDIHGNLCIIMEYVEGVSLSSFDTKSVSSKFCRDLLLQVSKGLGYIHAKGLIHRDIKPSNIMRSIDDRFILLDFGLALDVEATRLTATGDLIGTFGYLAPEQLRLEEPGPYTDVYQLGVTLYMIITGFQPFTCDELLLRAVSEDKINYKPLSEVRPDLDLSLLSLIESCMHPNISKRPQTGFELERAIVSLTKNSDTAAQKTKNMFTHPMPIQEKVTPTIAARKFIKGDEQFDPRKLVLFFIYGLLLVLTSFLCFRSTDKAAIECTVKPTRNKFEAGDYAKDQMVKVADECLLGIDKEVDPVMAFQAFSVLHKEGYLPGTVRLASCYLDGIGTPVNKKKALSLLKVAAEQGSTDALIVLGGCYLKGRGVKVNKRKAFANFEFCVEHQSVEAIHLLADCYKDGSGVERNEQKAYELYFSIKDTDMGLLRLGDCFRKGIHVERDEAKALKKYKESASKDFALAYVRLHYCYSNGIGTPTDLQEAHACLVKGAALGSAEARYLLGRMIDSCESSNWKQKKEAFYLYKQAALQGWPAARTRLAECYRYGIGVKKNSQKALDWKRLAEEQGHKSQVGSNFEYVFDI